MKKYSIQEIKKWWNAQDGGAQIFDIIPTERAIDLANGYIPNTHVEDENKFHEQFVDEETYGPGPDMSAIIGKY